MLSWKTGNVNNSLPYYCFRNYLKYDKRSAFKHAIIYLYPYNRTLLLKHIPRCEKRYKTIVSDVDIS